MLKWRSQRYGGLSVPTWCGLLLFGVALVTTGDRLGLRRPAADRLLFAHTFTTASERAILDEAVKEFEAGHPGMRIEQVISNSEIYNTVGWRLQFRSRKAPDVYFHWEGYKVDSCVANGWALDLTPWLSPGFVDEFVAGSVQRRDGGIHCVPHSADISVLVWYDADRFEAEDWSEPIDFEGWLALNEAIRERGVLPMAQGNRDLWPMGNFAAELMGQALGEEGLRRMFEPEAMVEEGQLTGLGRLVAMREAGSFDLAGVLERGGIGGLGDIDAKVMFLGGRSAQHVLGSWFLADVQDARRRGELGFKVGVFPVPPGRGEADAMTAVRTGFLVNPATRNPGAAVEFIELLLSRKYQGEFAKLGTLSLRRDAREFTEEPLAGRLLEILGATPVLVPPPDTGYRPDQANVFYELCGRLLTGRLDLSDAAAFWNRGKAGLARKGL